MTMISGMSNGLFEARVEALKAELGSILTARILEAEAVDFLWEARIRERYLGQHFDMCFPEEHSERELSRVAILSAFEGEWHAASCLVDGDGCPVDLLWKRSFESRDGAEDAFIRAA